MISNWKNKVDELNIGKLETTPVDLSKLSDVVKNEVVKKTVYMMNWLKKSMPLILVDLLKNKKPNVCNLLKKGDYYAKIPQLEKNILLLLIKISSLVIYLIQR